MTNEQILKKAIEKAVKGGFTLIDPKFNLGCCFNCILFSHDFAKAFWGNEIMPCESTDPCSCDCLLPSQSYLYHLSQMVLEKEPLKYIEKFL